MSDTVTDASNEALVFEKVRDAMAKVHEAVGTKVRSQHPKSHGTVQAVFQVHEVPDAYRVGVFADPKYYAAWIRFSNGKEMDDRKADVRGMAIKLLDVPGTKLAPEEANATTQDFILANHPVFFARDAKHFLQFLAMKGAHGGELKTAKAEGKSTEELAELEKQQTIQLVTAFPIIREFFKTATSPLNLDYFSQTPYQFGDRVVKYFVKPLESGPDLLGFALQQRLTSAQGAAQFEFGVELQTDPQAMPVDDATKTWNSPEQVILATITIPPQDFRSDIRVAFGDALSYSPWHSLPEHQPVGSINLARLNAYDDSSVTRHTATGAVRQEPDLSHFNSLTLARFFECFSKGDYRGMQLCLHPEIEFSDIGFELRGKEVGAMWHMIISKGIRVSFRDIIVSDDHHATAHWECDYEFRKNENSAPRPIHNVVDARFRFEGGLIREHHDTCDFWTWFEQATGVIGKGAHLLDFLEEWVEQRLNRDIPIDVEQKTRAKVKETARQKISAFINHHPEYAP